MTTPSPEVVGLMVRLGDALGTAVRPSALTAHISSSVASTRSLFAAAACSCALVEPDGGTLRFVAADGAGAQAIVDVVLPIGRGIAGWAVMSGQPILVADAQQDARFARDVAESTAYIPQTILAAPLVDEAGEVAGVIEVLDPQHREEHSGRDLDVLGCIAAQLASIVRLAEVYDGLGTALVRALAGSATGEEFGTAIAEVARTGGSDAELAALASTFHRLAATGPEGVLLAGRVLEEVAAFANARR
jgi:signal transduction protein with GAF and PtsI domain